MKVVAKKIKNNGNILLAVILMLLIFFGGASLLSFSIIHSRILGARAHKIVQTNRMLQELIIYLHEFREELFANSMQDYLVPEKEFFTTTHFPKRTTPTKIEITPSFRFISTPLSGYKVTRVYSNFDVLSRGRYRALPSVHQLKSEVFVDILSGQIPLSFIPFFLGEKPGIPASNFMEVNRIIDKSDVPSFPSQIAAQTDVVAMAADALNIPPNKILMWRDIRAKIGLPIIDDPIPPGLYFIVESPFVRALFIQGNVEQLTFSISGSSLPYIQEIRLVINAQPYQLRYKPKEKYFSCWDNRIPSTAIFGEKIMVNGNILSMQQQGDAAFAAYANILLLVSGRTMITSDLRTQAYHLNVGEIQLTSLTLATGLEQLYGMEAGIQEPALVVDTVNKTNIEATVFCDGTFINNSQTLQLSGSLYCQRLENTGLIELQHIHSGAQPLTPNAPVFLRTMDLKIVSQFLVNYIQEVYNE